MEDPEYDKKSSLEAVFQEYSNSVINIILSNLGAYADSDPDTSPDDDMNVDNSGDEPSPAEESSSALDQEDKNRLKKIKERISSVRVKKKE